MGRLTTSVGRVLCFGLLVAVSVSSYAQFWSERQVLPPPDVTASGLFGWSLSMDGDLMLVGAPGSSDLEIQSGAAYLFQRNNGGENQWDLLLKLIPEGIAPGARFGTHVFLKDAKAFVGAPFDIVNGIGQGSVYIFEQNTNGDGTWGLVQRVSTPIGSLNMRFGAYFSVGDLLVVGAPDYDIDLSTGSNPVGGIAIFEEDEEGLFRFLDLYDRGGSGLSIEQFADRCFTGVGNECLITPFDSLLSSDTVLYSHLPFSGQLQSTESFGFIIQGTGPAYARTQDRLATTVRTAAGGQVHTFIATAGEIVQEGLIMPDTMLHDASDRFGEALAAEIDRIVIGAPGGQLDMPLGWAGVYERAPEADGGWRSVQRLVPSDPEFGSIFGRTVAIANAYVTAGAPGYGDDDRGKVYVFADPEVHVAELPSTGIVRFSPVPADDWITVVRPTTNSALEAVFYDVQGRPRLHVPIEMEAADIWVGELEPGLYFVNVRVTGEATCLAYKTIIIAR